MYKQDLALNNQQWLICHKIKPNLTDTTSQGQTWPGCDNNDTLLLQGQTAKCS